MEQTPLLLPQPRMLKRLPGYCNLDRPQIAAVVDPALSKPEQYRLHLAQSGVKIFGQNEAAIFYARQTLQQIIKQFGPTIPCLEIDDWPDFPARGVMLDVSRDKVPTMATLRSLIDMLASWKINQLQLYTEHTFAYRNHREVWNDASPFTADEIRELDQYCRDRFIELVPNQNSLGHMERWLKHPRYVSLAEAPDGSVMPSGARWPGPFSLCPTDPRSIELLAELYAELLPNFLSRLFNVGCDETFDIGQGRSARQCAERGTTRVYLDFVKQLHVLVKRHGRTMMFWGDIIKEHPEMIDELAGAIGLVWGYEADSPFDAECAAFAKAGCAFYVCPGTSSWCSIAGRTANMLANAKSAAQSGLKHGAIGYLMTDWGDYGHLQYLPISYAGFAASAAYSWCAASNDPLPLARLLDLHAFGDRAGVMGQIACDLGNVYQATRKLINNSSSLFRILVPPLIEQPPAAGISAEGLDAAEAAIERAVAPLAGALMDSPDAAIIIDEFRNAAAMLKLACVIGRGELSARQNPSDSILRRIVDEHRRLWLARNRPGGLEDSVSRLTRLEQKVMDH